jgi:hypothetical protein
MRSVDFLHILTAAAAALMARFFEQDAVAAFEGAGFGEPS